MRSIFYFLPLLVSVACAIPVEGKLIKVTIFKKCNKSLFFSWQMVDAYLGTGTRQLRLLMLTATLWKIPTPMKEVRIFLGHY